MPIEGRRSLLQVEQLEDRSMPTVFTVTSAADTIARGNGLTLREAVTAIATHRASGDAPAGSYSSNTIRFAIPSRGVQTIRLHSTLPTLTSPVFIDATTQPGYRTTPLIQLDGTSAGLRADGLVLAGGYSSVRGLAIVRFGGSGIVLSSSHNVVAADHIGVDASGYFAAGNGIDGIRITAAQNTIGGSRTTDRVVVSGNKRAGIEMTGAGAWGNTVQGSYIGTDANGFAAVANVTGILIHAGASRNTIGGVTRAVRNVITGNRLDEIEITDRGTSGNKVQGNFIGTGARGEAAALSGRDGVRIDTGATGNTIGGTVLGAGNLISGAGHLGGTSPGAGITLIGTGTTGNTVQGNWVGLDKAGLTRLTNIGGGILVRSGASGNTIGGWTRAAQNVISDQVNTSGLTRMNQILAADWYVHSIDFLLNPTLLHGSFKA
jgi:hypothetical protein